MFTIPNIYRSKHLKYFIIIPLLLMLAGIYFSTKIQLDASLKGGVNILLQTNTNVSPSELAGLISSKLNIAVPTVVKSPGGLQITLPINDSLATAEAREIAFYAHKANYSNAALNATSIELQIQRNGTNASLESALGAANASANSSLLKMKAAAQQELNALQPFGISGTLNAAASPDAMQILVQNAYTNASNTYEKNVIAPLHTAVSFSSYSYQQVTSTFGSLFLEEIRNVLIVTFILVFFVVLFIFRSPIPSFTVVFGAVNDIVIALGAMGLFGIPLGLASTAGLLMLVGYSIDTDVLTAIRILRRHEGSAEDRAYASMQTGITMTASAIVSFGVLFAVSLVAYVPTYFEISGVVLAGLLGDVITTWLGNASLILLYQRRREKV